MFITAAGDHIERLEIPELTPFINVFLILPSYGTSFKLSLKRADVI